MLLGCIVLTGLLHGAPGGEEPRPIGQDGGREEARIRAEIGTLADRLGSGDADAAARARLREILGGLAARVPAGGEDSAACLDAILFLTVSPKRTAAMEGALALLSIRGRAGSRALLGALPRIDMAVARQALELMIGEGRDLEAVAPDILAALSAEERPESAERLVRLAAGLGTVEAARAVLHRAPPPGAAPDLEAACVEALARLAGSPGPRSWIEGEAFTDAVQSPGRQAVLAGAAAAVPLDGALPRLLGLLDAAGDKALPAVLAAVGRLARPETEGGGAAAVRLETFLAGARAGSDGDIARQAAGILAGLDLEAAARALSAQSRDPSPEVRRAAAEALGEVSGSDGAFAAVSLLIDDPNREVRSAAFASLRRFRRKESIERAIGLIASTRGPRREAAEGFLEWASGRKPGTGPREWETWWAAAREGYEFPAEVPARPEEAAGRATVPGEAPAWKVTPLLVGLCSLGEDHVLGAGRPADRRIPFALYAFLLEGPGGAVVLVDLGPKTLAYTNEMFRRYGFFRETAGAGGAGARPDDIVQPEGNVLDQLRRRGIGPERVGHIIFSHLHADHHGMDDAKGPGAAADFPKAVLHVSRKGWEDNLRRRRPEGGWGSYVDFAFSDHLLAMGEKGRCIFEDDAEVLPGVRTRYLGGHSECSQAVIIDLADGQAVLASDEVYHYRFLEEGLLARIRTESGRLLAATDLLASLAIDPDRTLIPFHDPAVHAAYAKAGDGWLDELSR